MARVGKPPYSVSVDVGMDNVDRRFEAIARGRWGDVGSALVETRSLNITDRLDIALKQVFVTVSRDGDSTLELQREDFTVFDGGKR